MQVFRSLEEVPPHFGPTVVSVGNFDGVHRAHQEVVRHMAERAHALGGKAVVVTFEPHPLRILASRCRAQAADAVAGQAASCWSRPAWMPCWCCRSPATSR